MAILMLMILASLTSTILKKCYRIKWSTEEKLKRQRLVHKLVDKTIYGRHGISMF